MSHTGWFGVYKTGSAILCHVRLKEFLHLYFGGLLLVLAGLHQAEGASSEMPALNWKPFIYGGMASIVAEFGNVTPVFVVHSYMCCHVNVGNLLSESNPFCMDTVV